MQAGMKKFPPSVVWNAEDRSRDEMSRDLLVQDILMLGENAEEEEQECG